MKKLEAEKAIRTHAITWANELGIDRPASEDLDFDEFLDWVRRHDPECLNFRSRYNSPVAKLQNVERWWAGALGQLWKY